MELIALKSKYLILFMILFIFSLCSSMKIYSGSRSKKTVEYDYYAITRNPNYLGITEDYYNDSKNKFLQGVTPVVWKHPVSGTLVYYIPRDEWDKRYWDYQAKLKKEAEEKEAARKEAEEEQRRQKEKRKRKEEERIKKEDEERRLQEQKRQEQEEEWKKQEDIELENQEDDEILDDDEPKKTSFWRGFKSLLWSGE